MPEEGGMVVVKPEPRRLKGYVCSAASAAV
jgi:hypothetical protein